MVACPGNVLELCAGIGGFSLGLERPGGRTVGYVERDAYAAAVLVARMEEAVLDSAPVWDDLTTFDGKAWRGVVDTITAGFPCQPFSVAGKHRGTDDERWLWPAITNIIRDVRPRYVFLENVPGVLVAGLSTILTDLAKVGFDAEWDMFSAADIGAPHKRERFFLLAHAPNVGHERTGRARRRGARPAHHRFPPLPDDLSGWAQMPAEAQPSLCRDADGVPAWLERDWADRIRCLGNAVVPDVVVFAWKVLGERIEG